MIDVAGGGVGVVHLGRYGGNEFDHFSFPFLEVGSRKTELFCNYPTRNKKIKVFPRISN